MQINLSERTLRIKEGEVPFQRGRKEYHPIIISITDELGKRIGLGECAPLAGVSCDADAYIRMSDAARLINEALASEDYAKHLSPYPALLFALESALYDFQQNPLLYDTPFAHSQTYIPSYAVVDVEGNDQMLSRSKRMILKGFRHLKLRMGEGQRADVLKVIQTLRSRFSKDTLKLSVDAQGTFDLEEAKELLKELKPYDIHLVEQPVRQYQWKDMAVLCQMAREEGTAPIALDEELIGVNVLEEKRILLDTIRPQFIVVRPMLHGGITGSIEWASEAMKREVGVVVSVAHEGNIGLRNVALLAARIFGPSCKEAQGLGAGPLYRDDTEMDVEMQGNKLWRCLVED
ncbi:MAG: o-succinylbenzoate synthase [Bacteroidaceae bacterium]|nr:o-succinylbenzoate synthase [Bacteroidaceae bacterium]